MIIVPPLSVAFIRSYISLKLSLSFLFPFVHLLSYAAWQKQEIKKERENCIIFETFRSVVETCNHRVRAAPSPNEKVYAGVSPATHAGSIQPPTIRNKKKKNSNAKAGGWRANSTWMLETAALTILRSRPVALFRNDPSSLGANVLGGSMNAMRRDGRRGGFQLPHLIPLPLFIFCRRQHP